MNWIRAQVIAYILTLPADSTLASIIEALAQLLEDPEEERLPPAVPLVDEIFLLLKTMTDRRDYLMFRVFYASGIRQAELLGLRVADVLGPVLFIRSGKYDQDRYVLVDPLTAELLSAWIQDKPPDGRVFHTSHPVVFNNLRKWAVACGLHQKYQALGQRVSPHSFRHACATHCFQGQMRFRLVQLLLGHTIAKNTYEYIHSTVEDRSLRYQKAVKAERGAARLDAFSSRGSGEPDRDEVVDYILEHASETAVLSEILDILCRWQKESTPIYEREYLQQLEEEVPLQQLIRGKRLPYVPFADAIWSVAEAMESGEGQLAARVLYRSGVFLRELELMKFSEIDFSSGVIGLPTRPVVVDPDTLQVLDQWRTAHPEQDRVFTLSTQELASSLEVAAERTGLAERFRAVDRKFTPNCLRHAYATHLLEAGLDIVCLHALLGNVFFGTTERYYSTAIAGSRDEYLRCHPLASTQPSPSGPVSG